MLQLLFVLSLLTLSGNVPEVSGRCGAIINPANLNWASRHGQSILFLEHLQRKAVEEDLFNWKNDLASEEYQVRLRQIESEASGRPTDPFDDCADDASSLPILINRVTMLEERLENCHMDSGMINPCYGKSYGGENQMRKIAHMHSELRRQQVIIQRMAMQISHITAQIGCSEGEAYSQFHSFQVQIRTSFWIVCNRVYPSHVMP